jgi:hypothetical protein
MKRYADDARPVDEDFDFLDDALDEWPTTPFDLVDLGDSKRPPSAE